MAEITTGPWEELLDTVPELVATIKAAQKTGNPDREWKWRLLDAAAGYALEVRAANASQTVIIADLEAEVGILRRRIVELTAPANRWEAVRRDVSRFFKLYSADPRHEKFSPGRPDPAEMADTAADRVREVRP